MYKMLYKTQSIAQTFISAQDSERAISTQAALPPTNGQKYLKTYKYGVYSAKH